MDVLAKLTADLAAKKRKVEGASVGAAGDGASAVEGGLKKKVYRTNGQTKQLLQQKMAVEVKSAHKSGEDGPLSPDQAAAQAGGSKKWIPKQEVIKRLRALRAPITLYAEEDEARLSRLRKLELSAPDEDNEGTMGQKNFLVEEQKKASERALLGKGEDSDDDDELSPEERKEKKVKRLAKLLDAEDKAQKSSDKYEMVRTWLRRMLKEWEIDIDDLPVEVVRSVQGRNEVNTYKQTKMYIKPLFKVLKTKDIERGVVWKLADITKFARQREYIKAADVYLILSIGKAAWPMGVTMVGIHERSAREKINSSDTAHILNDETQRKYIQSVKRLMTYAQNKFPPDSFTQAMEPTAIDKHAPTILKAMGKSQLTGILSNKYEGATDFSARY